MKAESTQSILKLLYDRKAAAWTLAESTQPIQKLLYDRKQAAWALSVSIRTIDYLIASGALETRRIGRKVLITASSLKRYAAANHYGPVNGTEEEAALKKHATANHLGPVSGSEEEAA